jgi:hypothetical protein
MNNNFDKITEIRTIGDIADAHHCSISSFIKVFEDTYVNIGFLERFLDAMKKAYKDDIPADQLDEFIENEIGKIPDVD